MTKKTVILIDGQNLYYGLKDMKILEKDILWDKLFQSLLDKDDELIRTYWFRPQKILDSYYSSQNIKAQVIKSFFKSYKGLEQHRIPSQIEFKIDEKVTQIEEWIKEQKIRFSHLEYAYDQISLEFNDIEIVKKGIVKINPYQQVYIGEKGVDISLAVKMISLSVQKKCDKIILLSGDYDYAEAISFVKDNMTKVNIVKFHKGIPPKNKSVSRDLAVLADKIIDVYEEQIRSEFIKLSSRIVTQN